MILEVPANVEDIGGSVLVNFTRDPGRDLIRSEGLGSEVVIPFVRNEWRKYLFAFMPYREREGEFIAVACRITARVSDTELDTAAVFDRKILPFITDGQVEADAVFEFFAVTDRFAAAVNVSWREIEVLVKPKVKSGADAGIDRVQPVLAETNGSESKEGEAIDALAVVVRGFHQWENESCFIPDLEVAGCLRTN